MESIGEKFRVTREQKGYSIEQISRDTNIAKRFLQALESEDFKAFPGEPYLLGFLRNYAEYLGLDPEEITTLYKHMMIQEQPIPMAELIVRKKGKAPVVVILAVVAAAGILTAGYFLLLPRLRSPRPEKAPTETAAERTGADVYVLSEEVVERRFSEGQVIQVTIKDVPYRIVIEEIGEKVTLALGSRKVQIRLGQEENLDLDGDTGAELKVFLRDIDAQANAVVLRFDRFLKAVIPGNVQTAEAGETETNGAGTQAQPLVPSQSPTQQQAQAAGTAQQASSPALGSTTVASRKRAPVILKEADAPSPFTVSVVFRGYCLVRYIMDGQIRDERYFHKGETFELKDVEQEVRFWLSNAGSFKAKIAGIDTDLGKPGEVTTNQITWIRDEQTGKYRLTIVPVY
jgi:cytoskeletal protein RodZ